MVGTPTASAEMSLSVPWNFCVPLWNVPRLDFPAFLRWAAKAIFTLLCVSASAEERNGFVLSDDDLDNITAAGIAIVAESSSLTSAYGPVGLSDSVADTQVDPEAGFADANGYAVGSDGSDGYVDVWVFGEDTDFSFVTEAEAGGIEEGERLTSVSAFGYLSVNSAGIYGGSEASADSHHTFADSLTQLTVTRQNVLVSGFASVDSVGARDGISAAMTAAQESWTPDTYHMVIEASGMGSDVTTSTASVSTSAQHGATTINMSAQSEGASTNQSHAKAEVRLITTSSIAIAAARGSSTLQGRVMQQPSAATEIDVEGGLFQANSIERENKTHWQATSTTMAVIRTRPGM